MKKRIVSLILIGAMAISLCACGDSNNSSSSNAESNASTQTTSSQGESSASSGEDDGLPKGDRELIASWGHPYNPRTEGAAYYINCLTTKKDNLYSTVPDEGYSYLVDERDPYGEIALDAAKTVEEIRPTYEKWIFYDLKEAEGVANSDVKNQKMTIDSTENIKVNEYEICVNKGTYSCDVEEHLYTQGTTNVNSKEYPYICYSTFLTTGTPVYWVLIDRSEDKSKGNEMEETAMNMAKTLREFDPDDPMSEKEARGEE